MVGATRRSWAKDNEKDLIGYIRGYRAALDWLFDPANKAEAIAILRKHLPNMTEEQAMRSYDILVHPTKGFTRGAVLNVEGVKTVLQLRSQYTGKPLNDAGKYFDPLLRRGAQELAGVHRQLRLEGTLVGGPRFTRAT